MKYAVYCPASVVMNRRPSPMSKIAPPSALVCPVPVPTSYGTVPDGGRPVPSTQHAAQRAAQPNAGRIGESVDELEQRSDFDVADADARR